MYIYGNFFFRVSSKTKIDFIKNCVKNTLKSQFFLDVSFVSSDAFENYIRNFRF